MDLVMLMLISNLATANSFHLVDSTLLIPTKIVMEVMELKKQRSGVNVWKEDSVGVIVFNNQIKILFGGEKV